ncbi:MAG: glycine--tRNA ligase subunit beta [Desulfobacteraceae bacterium]|nr:MAG: glycine--tRNA ligase subunit beta [Desulfobacteraceae bacterium]
MNRLLVEIGTEEIPAGYIQPALKSFASILLKKMDDARIQHGDIKTYGTPRRLAVIVTDVAPKQLSLSTEMMGPPERIGLDASGKLTVAAQKFAEKTGVPAAQLKVKETEKGRYFYAVKTERGAASKNVFKEMLPDVILSLPFPKSMRWADLTISFARPIHTIAALLGTDVIPFRVGNISSGRNTFGHRFMKPGKIRLSSPDNYLNALSDAWVLADTCKRKETLEMQMTEAVTRISGQVIPDDELLETVAHLIEYPAAIVGRFDEAFLELPNEILITAMREHQKYFAVVDAKDQLMPYFVAINNTQAKDMDLVTKGHERVLRARLSDAQFFVATDLKTSLDDKVEKLKSVLFQANLGSMLDKTNRVIKLADWLATAEKLKQAQLRSIARAAHLCKADLVSHAVIEFPKLQGVMGRVYALKQNEEIQTATAIEEHYRPTYSGGALPETLEGSVLSISDKMDSICGCFSAGLIPTGAADPYALRRQANGIILIALKNRFGFSLKAVIRESLTMFEHKKADDIEALSEKIVEFFKGRMAHLLEEENISKDAVAAVLAVSTDTIGGVWEKARSLQKLKSAPDFEILATAFKRVVNIIRKADTSETAAQTVEPALFEHESERALLEQFRTAQQNVLGHIHSGQIDQAFGDIALMREPVDRFFDDVMVMAEDAGIRKNRLALLGQIAGLFDLLADFSKIST